jgi:hypothetical protein
MQTEYLHSYENLAIANAGVKITIPVRTQIRSSIRINSSTRIAAIPIPTCKYYSGAPRVGRYHCN